jgi:hypothetical protein
MAASEAGQFLKNSPGEKSPMIWKNTDSGIGVFARTNGVAP